MASNYGPPRRGPGPSAVREMPGIRLQPNEHLDVVVSHIEPNGTIFVQVCISVCCVRLGIVGEEAAADNLTGYGGICYTN